MKLCGDCKIEKPIEYFRMNGKYRRSNCKACQDSKNAQWAKKNKAKVKEYLRDYYQENKEKLKESMKEWQKRHPGYSTEQQRKWVRENPKRNKELSRLKAHRRRTFVKDLGNYTIEEWDNLCTYYNNECVCCFNQVELTVDHIIPISRGGSNRIENIQPLCKPCNSKKYTKIISYINGYMIV